MLTLHHLSQSRSFRILWLLCELNAIYGTPFKVIKHERTKSYLAPRELMSIHSMGKAPILVDEVRDRTLVESGFIIEYLLRHYDMDGRLSPTDDTWEDYAFWLHFAESSMMPPLVMRLVMTKTTTKSPLFVRPIAKAIANKIENLVVKDSISQSFGLLNAHLAGKEWIADSFTGADIQAYFSVKALQSRGGLGEWDNLKAWLIRCENRSAYQHTIQRSGEILNIRPLAKVTTHFQN